MVDAPVPVFAVTLTVTLVAVSAAPIVAAGIVTPVERFSNAMVTGELKLLRVISMLSAAERPACIVNDAGDTASVNDGSGAVPPLS
jgi:hypothetical protein